MGRAVLADAAGLAKSVREESADGARRANLSGVT